MSEIGLILARLDAERGRKLARRILRAMRIRRARWWQVILWVRR